MNIFEKHQKLFCAFGPSGGEAAVARIIIEAARPLCDEITIDVMGNVIARKKGTGKKIMLTAHMDTSGIAVTHIDEHGFIRFGRVGKLNIRQIAGCTVEFADGLKGVVSVEGQTEKPGWDDFYIDIGADDAKDAKTHISVGDMAVFAERGFTSGNKIVSPSIGGRIACAILLEVMEYLDGRGDSDVYFAFCSQEQVGSRGVKTAAFAIDPDFNITVDVAAAKDTPGAETDTGVKLGGGAAIKIMDNSCIYHPQMVEFLKKTAGQENIARQLEISDSGGGSGVISQTRVGVYTGAVSIPCRYVGSLTEMCDARDAEAAAKLLLKSIENIHTF